MYSMISYLNEGLNCVIKEFPVMALTGVDPSCWHSLNLRMLPFDMAILKMKIQVDQPLNQGVKKERGV